MWIYKGKQLGREVIPGVPPTDLTDEEFATYTKIIDAQFGDGIGNSLERSGLWENDKAKGGPVKNTAPVLAQEIEKESVVNTEKGDF